MYACVLVIDSAHDNQTSWHLSKPLSSFRHDPVKYLGKERQRLFSSLRNLSTPGINLFHFFLISWFSPILHHSGFSLNKACFPCCIYSYWVSISLNFTGMRWRTQNFFSKFNICWPWLSWCLTSEGKYSYSKNGPDTVKIFSI